jgi:hypothetical protein
LCLPEFAMPFELGTCCSTRFKSEFVWWVSEGVLSPLFLRFVFLFESCFLRWWVSVVTIWIFFCMELVGNHLTIHLKQGFNPFKNWAFGDCGDLNLIGFDMCIWWLSITGCRWIRSSFSENNQRTPLQRVDCGRRDRVPNHRKRGDDDYWLKFSTALPQMFRRGICAESGSVSSSYPMQSVRITCCGAVSVCFFPASFSRRQTM